MTARYDLLVESFGYRDFCEQGLDYIDTYVYVGSGGNYAFDADTQTFSAGTTHNLETRDIWTYENGIEYESYFDTINVIFNTEEIKDKNIKAHVIASVSRAQIESNFASDGNYVFSDNFMLKSLGQSGETGSFANTTVRYRGSKPSVQNDIRTGQRNSKSIKFRIKTKLGYEDDIAIYYMSILPTGLIFNGGFDG